MATMLERVGSDRLTIGQWAKKLDVNISTIWRWAQTGCRGHKLRSVSVGARRFITAADMETFLATINGESPAVADATPITPAPAKLRATRLNDQAERLGV